MNGSLPQERALKVTKAHQTNSFLPAVDRGDTPHSAEAFETLFLDFWPTIYHMLLRMLGDPAEAEDLALETFLRFHRRPPTTGQDFNPGGWLYRVAVRLALHSIRRAKRREYYEFAAGRDALQDPAEDRPAEIVDHKETHRLARLALARINPRQSEILLLRYSGMAYKEIANLMGLAPSSIGPLLLRAEREFEKVYRALSREEP
jgi:RNA polymerase sigma factor (sigma-70 family)